MCPGSASEDSGLIRHNYKVFCGVTLRNGHFVEAQTYVMAYPTMYHLFYFLHHLGVTIDLYVRNFHFIGSIVIIFFSRAGKKQGSWQRNCKFLIFIEHIHTRSNESLKYVLHSLGVWMKGVFTNAISEIVQGDVEG